MEMEPPCRNRFTGGSLQIFLPFLWRKQLSCCLIVLGTSMGFKKKILEFYLLWHIKAIYTEQSVSKPWHCNLERWLTGHTHTEKVLPRDPARILKGTNLQWTALRKSPSGLWSTWAWACIPGSGHDVSSRSVKKGVSSCKETKDK